MRRWPLTVGMGVAAAGAAWLAPRLLVPGPGEAVVQALPEPAPAPGILVHRDRDGDGFGDEVTRTLVWGGIPAGYVAAGGDCDDDRASVHPGAAEVPGDGVDQDCDGRDGARASGIPELDERLPSPPVDRNPAIVLPLDAPALADPCPACGMG